MIANDECTPAEIRLWRVAHAMHANIPRSVVRQAAVIDHRAGQPVSQSARRELLDLALNILTLFVPPKRGARDDSEPIKCFRGHCSVFAARHHEQFMRDFIAELGATGGAIASERIRAWIEEQRATKVLEHAEPCGYEDFAASA